MAKASEAKKEAPATEKDDSILGSLCELGNSLGDMILSPIEDAIKEVAKPGKDDPEAPEVKPTAKGKNDGTGNGSDKHSISINLGGFFQSDKADKRAAAAAKKKGKAAGVEEPDDDEPADE